MQQTRQTTLRFEERAGATVPASRDEASRYVQGIFEREMGVTLNNARAGSHRDEAMRELTRETANLYARRVLRELVQNAYDGARSAAAPRILLRLDLTQGPHGTIYVANNGQGFTSENVDAISNPAMSNKTPGNFIGHKGLGFRSVEILSDAVEIHSKADPDATSFDGFCFRFAAPEDERAWMASSEHPDFADVVVGKVHRLQLPVPIPASDAKADALAAAGFSTLVRLPLRDALAGDRAAEELRLLLDEKAPITLFLDRLESLVLETIDANGDATTKQLRRSSKGIERPAFGRSLTIEEVSVDRHRFLVGRMEVDDQAFRKSVALAVEEKHPVARWEEWVGPPTVSVALPLSQDARAGSFYAFLPMDTPAPFNGCLDAPFYPNANRRDLDLDNSLNSFLLDSVAELCLAVARSIASSGTTSLDRSAAAVDAISWHGDAQRLIDACERTSFEMNDLMLPAIRRADIDTRWAPLSEIFDWDDEKHRVITGQSIVRACAAPMLRRSLGPKRLAALREFIAETDFVLDPADQEIARWAPLLAQDLAARRRKATKQDWEGFYLDLASLRSALVHMRGKKIFRLEDGELGAANSPETLSERELFISADPENATRTRKRLAGTSLFPPKSVAKRMRFADPTLSWPQPVTAAFVAAGLATEYSLPRVIAGMGRLLGKRPARQTALAAISWAFTAWKSHKSNEVERALQAAQLFVPGADGKLRVANSARFGAGWRDTMGDTLKDLCDEIGSATRPTKAVCDSLLVAWDDWPLRERGSAADWTQFLRLIGVRDGLRPVYFPSVTEGVNAWQAVRRGYGPPLSFESRIGGTWRAALAKWQRSFSYASGQYASGDTLWALPLQAEHEAMNDRARQAFARLVAKALPDLDAKFFTTILSRTAGMGDNVAWPSPLAAFLQEAEWLPVVHADTLSWRRPRDCWFAPKGDALPRFLPRLERPIRDILDGSSAARDVFAQRLGLRLWNERGSAPARLEALGDLLERGIAEHEHDSFRSEYRQAWGDWAALDPQPAVPPGIALAVQDAGRMAAYRADPESPQTLFVSGGGDPTLDNLLMALGHRLLSVPADAAKTISASLAARGQDTIRLAEDVRPKIIVDGSELDLDAERPRLVEGGREWLAEIAVLALEFNASAITRSTPRSRQLLFDDFRRLRIVHAREVQVEVDGRAGPLPDMLAGVLPVPHPERPTIVLEGQGGAIDWTTMARLSRGIALSLGRSWLITDFRMVFLAVCQGQPQGAGLLTRPDDDAIATAFGQPVARVREIQRSLRVGSRRIMDWLLPIVGAQRGHESALALLEREAALVEDHEIIQALATSGYEPDAARLLVEACREAQGLDELRRSQSVQLADFNAASAALGPRFAILRFEPALRRAFDERVAELRPTLAARVRDAFASADLQSVDLAGYRAALPLDWITFDERWPDTMDALPDAAVDDRIADLARTTLPDATVPPGAPLDALRQGNRDEIANALDEMRRVVAAWAAKAAGRSLPPAWTAKADGFVRDAITSGICDFAPLARADLPPALAKAGMWPAGMPHSLDLETLGLEPGDLDVQRKAEEKRRSDEARRSRTMTFGQTDIEGGTSGSFALVVDALRAGLENKRFQSRSGPAVLRPFPEGDERPPRRRTPGKSDREPSFLTDQQRDLIGFAGEYAAYVHLRRTVRNFADDHWVSSIGRRYLCLPIVQDGGYDFHVPRSRGGLYYEVKAHVGDPGHVDLERSQVEAAVLHAAERNGVWKILYVSNVLDPDQITVHELANPFSEGNMRLFRTSTRQGVRLLIDRE